jgi:murein DD-endopeptidase MepM/ murein hydrolase activator NlpD
VFLTRGSVPARASTPGQLRQQISAGQGRVSALSGAVSAANGRVHQLGVKASALEAEISRLQADLDVNRAKLLRLRDELSAARVRLAQLEARQTRSEHVLSNQLVGSYEGNSPDIVSVVLNANSFNDLLEQLSFAQRVGNQDAHVLGQVRAARRAVAAEATRLGTLSARQQKLTTTILMERNGVARARLALVSQQIAAERVRNAKASQLSAARHEVASLRTQLGKVEAAERAAAQQASSSPSSGAPPSTSGDFTFPMPKADVSPPATWSLDDGVDISAPGGTPEFAVCSGTLVLHGIGGFGPSAPVLHCDSPLAGYDYVYYGHAGPGNWVAVGTHVGQGQVISEVGSGIVGISTGPHLEIGFADSSGSPIGGSSAPAMMSLLQSSY